MTIVIPKLTAELVSTRQVATLCGVTTRTVFRWLEAGILPNEIRIGGNPKSPIRWKKTDIEAWLAANCQSSK
jgi:predicted DNA-binding transcriptional regulator AlpA